MSYASVAASNAPPLSEQPQPDPALLNTTPTTSNIVNDDAKVKLLPSRYKNRDQHHVDESNLQDKKDSPKRHPKRAQEKRVGSWEVAKHYILRPGVAGGLVGLAHVGIIFCVGRAFYNQPRLYQNRFVVSSTLAAALAAASIEGYVIERYSQTPRGHDEQRHVKEDGALIYLYDQILRPGVLGGILGAVNSAVIVGIGYLGYVNWDKAKWDKRIVSTISLGLLTLWGGEEYVASRK
ncbi:hypothetical protein H0H81_012018 [Sphagnurus paluster]|uniref:Uncharacterized protein n=1 Tax=Sphagnurus paluster TaxID=117069 RepID=A0A9P7FNF4_9AGAR|nr:hypothetical protein H0H81_012018 [Sphagnurus paluster]